MSGADRVRTVLRGLGQTLITLGLVLLLFCVYELQVTGLVTAREQQALGRDLQSRWAEPVARPAVGGPTRVARDVPLPGAAFARLYVPSLPGYRPWNVVEGVSVADLKKGPGHIPGTALPGAVGNVVLSGHRTTYQAPFNRFGELRAGDLVVLETRDSWFTYTVTGSKVVAPTAVEVTYAVPGDPVAVPTRRLLTMTTCNPKYSARQRLIISAELTLTTPKSAGRPPALAAGG